MFNVFDRYMMRQILVSTIVVSTSLAMIIMLAQSLRLIEIVLEANASASSFVTMMLLSAPRFLEAVLPASVLISTLFVLHRLGADSEIIVMRAGGASPLRLAKPVLGIGLGLCAFLFVISLWISPTGVAHMHTIRKEVQAQYGHLLFREGIFNSVGNNLTAYVRAKSPDGQLVGLMVHDTRGKNKVTVVARSGHMVSDDEGQKIIVYDGSRQEIDGETGQFSRLDFKQYTLEIPTQSGTKDKRWQEPEERTLGELLSSMENPGEAAADKLQYRAELHRRITTPALMLAFALTAAAFLLQGTFSRGGQMRLIISASLCALAMQGVYLVVFNMAKKTLLGCIMLYGVSLAPLVLAAFFLSPPGERMLAAIALRMQRLFHAGPGQP